MGRLTIVICPGAFPLPRIYEPLIEVFNERQHAAICMVQQYHPTSSTQTLPTVNPDSEYLRHSVLDPLLSEGKDIVVFAHSYGGIYAPASLEGTSKQERRAKGLEGGVVAVIPDEEANRLVERLSPQPYYCFTTPAHWDPYHSPAFRGKIG
ncbi:hypothetical protein V8F33_002623 [Rhypophila sp. PSN 637]